MCNRLTSLSVALLLSLAVAMPQSQSPDKPVTVAEVALQPPAKPQFFAGSVIEIDEQHVKVSRTLIGRPNQARVFRIDAKTKINRASVKMKARVTVRYLRLPDGDIALEIQLRPAVHATKP
ncbi:MAG TPA: hypothetical protein VGG97_11210 [Bryobacteraceae bacterium]|jgi:hypothetical protein